MVGLIRCARNFLLCALVILTSIFAWNRNAFSQNYDRYKPFNPNATNPAIPERVPDLPSEKLKEPVGDDRILVESLDSIVIVDSASKISIDPAIDDWSGLRHDFGSSESIVFSEGFRKTVEPYLGKPITLRLVNQLAADISKLYRKCKLPIVDVLIPEQRITGGTLHLVVIETRIDQVKVQPGCYFDHSELSRWIECTRPGNLVYEPELESDLFWLNQNPYRKVTVDFEKGGRDGTTNVIFKSKDVRPIRAYFGADDTGVESLNYGRLFTGLSYGNLWGRGGTLGYQYTTDQDFNRLHAHSVSYFQPLDRSWSFQSYGSWAGVTPVLPAGLSQSGESWQTGAGMVRHLIKEPDLQANLTFGADFKSTNNNLEFAGSTISSTNADLVQIHIGFDTLLRGTCPDEYSLFRLDTYVGPGGGLTGAHSTAAFNTIRPDTSPDYVYGRLRLEDSRLVREQFQLVSKFSGQAASERLLFSETFGLGGFDTIRGFDERAFNADQGWIANLELGPKSWRWGEGGDTKYLRLYSFMDIGNGYVRHAKPGEDAYEFVTSTGFGMRSQISDRLIARFDYGVGIVDLDNVSRDQRIHFGVTWIPGPRP